MRLFRNCDKDMMFSLVKKIETRAVQMSEIASKETSRKGQTS